MEANDSLAQRRRVEVCCLVRGFGRHACLVQDWLRV